MKRFEVGARVVEPTYGLGSVVAVEDAYTRVQFDEHGIKKFLPACRSSSRAMNRFQRGFVQRARPRKKRAPKKAEPPRPS